VLSPYADRNVVASWWSPAFVGSVARYLALLAATCGNTDRAAAHFEHAMAANARMALRGQLAHTKAGYAELLFARNDPGDRARALDRIAEARGVADELGLSRLRQKIAALTPPPSPSGAVGEPGPVQRAFMRRDGRQWTVGIENRTMLLKDGPGPTYLAALVRE